MDAERLSELRRLSDAATPPPWVWWTSNSWRRLTREGHREGGVLCPYVVRSDGHPDLSVSDADMAFIAAARDAVPELVAEVWRLRGEVNSLSAEALRLRDGRRGGGPYG